MVDGSTFSPADRDTKKAKGITHRQMVKYASTWDQSGEKETSFDKKQKIWREVFCLSQSNTYTLIYINKDDINLRWGYLWEGIILLCKVLEGHVMVHHYQHCSVKTKETKDDRLFKEILIVSAPFKTQRVKSLRPSYHKTGWSLGSSAVCRGRSAGGQNTPSLWRGRLPPSALGSPQTDRDPPAHLWRTGHIHRQWARVVLTVHVTIWSKASAPL